MSPLMMRFTTLVGIALAAASMQLKVRTVSAAPLQATSYAAPAANALPGPWR